MQAQGCCAGNSLVALAQGMVWKYDKYINSEIQEIFLDSDLLVTMFDLNRVVFPPHFFPSEENHVHMIIQKQTNGLQ